MTNTRRAVPDIIYKGVNISTDIAPYLISFNYDEAEGKSDVIELTLMDRDRKWQGPWIPKKGDKINASIKLENWYGEGSTAVLKCGGFYVDDVSFKGPPDTVVIKAISVPFNAGGKDTVKSRSWENATSDVIFGDLAAGAGLGLLYDAPIYTYDRVNQSKETDLTCAKRLAKREGFAVKVTDDQLIIYEEKQYEAKGAVRTLVRGDADIKTYNFKESAAEEQYAKVEVAYKDPKEKTALTYIYEVPGVSEGPTLKVNKRASSLEEAKRFAQAEARAKNKSSKSGSLSLLGNEKLVQGLTVNIQGFGAFDGKYYIQSSKHKVTGGYQTDISIREVLNY